VAHDPGPSTSPQDHGQGRVFSALPGYFLGLRFENAEPESSPGCGLRFVQQRGFGSNRCVAQPRHLSRLARQRTNFRGRHGHVDVSAAVVPALLVREGFPAAIPCKSSNLLQYVTSGIA